MKLLFNILNWGLGHATRSVPLIEKYISEGYEVHLASDGVALSFLQKRFPELIAHQLPSYKVTYSKGSNQTFAMLKQAPHFLRTLKTERHFIEVLHQKHKYELCISDNRFGCRIDGVHSVYITHQVQILAPFFEGVIKRLHGNIINQFDECWIPDLPPPNNLAGKLDADITHLKNAKYIGLLSHLNIEKLPNKYDITYLLSGPEPQRTILEERLVKSHQEDLSGLLIRGTNHPSGLKYPSSIEVKNLVDSKELEKLLGESRKVIVRSGYSSIMDLMNTHLELVFTPTPGQTEQEYLAGVMRGMGFETL